MTSLQQSGSEEHIQRYVALEKVFDQDRHGVVDGVEFDLRHPLLDPEEWGAYTLQFRLKLPLLRRMRGQPFLWFPWFGNFDKESVRAELESVRAKLLTDKKGKFSQRKVSASLLREYTPEYFLNAGDKLIVERVEREAIDGPFSHKHDQEVRLAFLCIIRANGKRERVKTPLMFAGVTSLFTGATSPFLRIHKKEWFDRISRRIFEHFNVRSYEGMTYFAYKNKGNKSYAYLALHNALLVKNGWEQIQLDNGWKEIQPDNEEIGFDRSEEKRRKTRTWRLVNSAIALGYLWAKAEDKIGMQPLAEASLRSREGGSKGGRESGAARREKRARTWEGHARELVQSIRAEDPSSSQDRVVEEICGRWKEAGFEPPGHRTLKTLISQMEVRGEVARRVPHRKQRGLK
jgi:hypothetical protein